MDEAELLATLKTGPSVAEVIRSGSGDYVEVDRVGWQELLDKANPKSKGLADVVNALKAGAAAATADSVIVKRDQAEVVASLAGE